MFAKIIPLVFLIFGSGFGITAAIFLVPGIDTIRKPEISSDKYEAKSENPSKSDYVKLSNQFVVPIMGEDRVAALVVLSLSLEVEPGMADTIYFREPKIRDAFLKVLFDHANMGGFRGSFTKSEVLDPLRTALSDVARKEFGDGVKNVLIVGIARQDT